MVHERYRLQTDSQTDDERRHITNVNARSRSLKTNEQYFDILNHLAMNHEQNRQTDRWTDRQRGFSNSAL